MSRKHQEKTHRRILEKNPVVALILSNLSRPGQIVTIRFAKARTKLMRAKATRDWTPGSIHWDDRREETKYFGLFGAKGLPCSFSGLEACGDSPIHAESSLTVRKAFFASGQRPQFIVELRNEEGEFNYQFVSVVIHRVNPFGN